MLHGLVDKTQLATNFLPTFWNTFRVALVSTGTRTPREAEELL